MDRLQTMSVFVAVAEEAGFAPAARRLNISPPSITRAVSDLEIRLGARLLHRTTRSVKLTEAGHRYLADCRRILSDVEEADRHAGGIHSAPKGLVSITASLNFGRVAVMPILLDLLDRYPDISVSTLLVDRVTHLVDEGIDVAVRIAELADSSMMAVRVGSVRRVLCASPDYLDRCGRPQQLSDLADHDFINFVNMTRAGDWAFYEDGELRNIKLSSRLNSNSSDVTMAAAITGRGIARALSYAIIPHVNSGALEIILEAFEPPALPVHVVHKEPGHTSARVRAVVDHLVHHLRENPILDH